MSQHRIYFFFMRSIFWRLKWFASMKPRPATQISISICQIFILFSDIKGHDDDSAPDYQNQYRYRQANGFLYGIIITQFADRRI